MQYGNHIVLIALFLLPEGIITSLFVIGMSGYKVFRDVSEDVASTNTVELSENMSTSDAVQVP